MIVFQSYVTSALYLADRASRTSWYLYNERGYIGEAINSFDLVKIGVFYDPSKDDIVEDHYYIVE